MLQFYQPDKDHGTPAVAAGEPWEAPAAAAPLDAAVRLPGSKSLTNRELVLAANKTAPSEGASKPAINEREQTRRSAADARRSLQPLKKTADDAEARLDKLSDTLRRLDEALAEPGLYEKNIARATKLQKERAALVAAIGQSEADWLAALEAYEDAKANA